SRRSSEEARAAIEKAPVASAKAVHEAPVVRLKTVAGWFKGDGAPLEAIVPVTVSSASLSCFPSAGETSVSWNETIVGTSRSTTIVSRESWVNSQIVRG